MEINNDMWLNMSRNAKFQENPKAPYFKISIPPQSEGGKWIEVGACWKGKKDGNYGFKLAKGVKLIIEAEDTGASKDVPFD
jgi:hypothetical protein